MTTPIYIKPSSVKSIIPPAPTNTGVDINMQVGNIKKQYGNMSTEQLYGAMLNVKPPAQQDILQAVGTQYGYNDRIAGLREQAGEIQKQMLSDQSALFGATNPDGTAVDPRVKVDQYMQNMTRGSQRLQQIQKIQDVYSAEMQTLAGAISDQYKSKAQDTQTAIQFMQQLNQEKNADRSFGLQKDQLNFQKENARNIANEGKWTRDTSNSNYVTNSDTGESRYSPLGSGRTFAESLGIIVGDYEGNRGRDFAGKLGEPVQAGGNWRVKSVIDTNLASSPYGNSVLMEDENGNQIRYSHLQSLNVKSGDTLAYGSIVGGRGNTGNVLGKNGEKLTAEQLKAGRGAHVDVEIKDATGRLMNKNEQMSYLGSIKAPEQEATMTPQELRELDALVSTSNLNKDDRERRLHLQTKFEGVNDRAKKEIPAYNALNRLLSAEGTNQGTTDTDVRWLREALTDYLKTGDEGVVLESIKSRIINAKDKSPLKGINDYAKIKNFADMMRQYSTTKNPNIFKKWANDLGKNFGVATDITDYDTFLQNHNMNEVLRIAGTSFTDAFINTLNNMNIGAKDTPEMVSKKLDGILKKAELEVSGAKSLIGENVLEQLYPGVFKNTPGILDQQKPAGIPQNRFTQQTGSGDSNRYSQSNQ